MHPIFEKYLTILLNVFTYDVEVMSQPWMYYFVLPIIGYLIFFIIKWIALTAPVWIPFSIIVGAAKPGSRKNKEKGE